MNVQIIHEAGYEAALFGLGLSHGLTSNTEQVSLLEVYLIEHLHTVALRLKDADGGHNKFLESIQVWIDIDAPRFWWSEFDTYRVGVSKQSESTMHTLGKRELRQDDFERPLPGEVLSYFNSTRDIFMVAKNQLPEGFLQRRIVSANYKALRSMILQRKSHRLPQWRVFIDALRELEHGELLPL